MRLSKLIIPVVGFVAIGVIVAMTSQKEQRIEEEKKAQIAKSEREKQQKITQCQSEFSNIQLICQSSNSIDEIRNAVEGFADRCAPYLGGKVSYLTSLCGQRVREIENKEREEEKQAQEREKRNRCIKEYSTLEKEFQDVTSGLINKVVNAVSNKDEKKVVEIKTQALQLKKEGCDRYTDGAVSRLIAKCNDKLK
jgi:predicted small secreted protein